MINNTPFYHRTIRKIVIAFGTIFNEINFVRYYRNNSEYERIKVPLAFGPKEKFITRLVSDPELTKSFLTTLPRMSFDMTGISYDASRKKISTQKSFTGSNSSGGVKSMYSPVPYDYNFQLSLYVRNIEDGTQIIEQILPYFTPDYTVTVNMVPEMGIKYDLPIVLNSVQQNIEYEGNLGDTRFITWTLDFTVKGMIFPPVTDVGIIRSSNTNVWIDTNKRDAQKVFVDWANSNGVFVTSETITCDSRNITGKVMYYSNNSLGTLVIEDMNDLLEVNDTVVGSYSNATATITSVDNSQVKALVIRTQPNPITANANDSFTYTETFFEWPETLIL